MSLLYDYFEQVRNTEISIKDKPFVYLESGIAKEIKNGATMETLKNKNKNMVNSFMRPKQITGFDKRSKHFY